MVTILKKILLIAIGVIFLIGLYSVSFGRASNLVIGEDGKPSIIQPENPETIYGRVKVGGAVFGDNIWIENLQLQKTPFMRPIQFFGGDTNIICSTEYEGKYYNQRKLGDLNAFDEVYYYFEITKPDGKTIDLTILCEGDTASKDLRVTIP